MTEPKPTAEPARTAEPTASDARRVPAWLRGIRPAFAFASRLPVGGFPYATSDWHWAPAHLPLVGVVVGGLSAAAFELCAGLRLSPSLAAAVALLSSIVLTGAFHEDGLADSADGLGGAHGGKRALEIMKDSHIGTYGVLALGLSLLVRVTAMAELTHLSWFALPYVHCLARIGPVWLLASEPSAGSPKSSKTRGLFATRPRHVAVAVGWGVACSVLGLGYAGLDWRATLATPVVLVLVTAACAKYFRRAVGGVNGDLLGATEQIGEMVSWIALLLARP